MSTLPDSVYACWLSGGDERLTPDPESGLNRYGHAPHPLPQALAFGSSTGSTPSTGALAAAEALHRQLAEALTTQDPRRVYEDAAHSVRAQISAWLGLKDTGIILAASGTDIHLLVSQLLGGPYDKPLTVLTPGGDETGSGVGLAVSGRHFMTSACQGRTVVKGAELSLGERSETITFAMRDAGGALRAAADVEADLEAAISTAVAQGRRCLLSVADVSKTGLIAPGLASVLRLKRRYINHLDILIDACQCRLSPQTLRAYLEQNFLVAITGSKFLGGPIFSGALLSPPRWSRRLRHTTLPHAVRDYSAGAEWPEGWAARRALGDAPNWGLVLRWQAALFEMQAFYSLPVQSVTAATAAFAEAVRARLNNDPAFIAVDSGLIDRSALKVRGLNENAQAFDALPTIFPFQLCAAGGTLTYEQAVRVHQGLAAQLKAPVHLGQPIRFGVDSAILRLCLSAPLLVRAVRDQAGLAAVVAEAMQALDHTAALSARVGKALKVS